MGRIYNAAGTEVTQATFLTAPYTTVVAQPNKYTVNQTIYERNPFPGHKRAVHGSKDQRVKYSAGAVITQAELDALFTEGTFASMTPTTGPAAGGTAVTINGTGFTEATGVTFNGVAATNFVVVSDTQITCTSPAQAAGARAVVVQMAAGNVACGNFTYA